MPVDVEGQCFAWANRNSVGDDVVVHAWVTDRDNAARGGQLNYWHAWIERDGKVLDWQSEVADIRRRGTTVAAFRRKYKPTRERHYKHLDTLKHMLRSGHHGPWHAL